MCDLINILSIIDDKTQLINFPKLDPNSFKPAVLALIQRLKDTVASVKASDKEPTWDTLVTPIEDASENLSYVWSVVEHLNSVADTPELRATINELLPPISEVFSELGMDEELYAKYKALKAEKAFEKFSSTRQRIINKELEGFVRDIDPAHGIRMINGSFIIGEYRKMDECTGLLLYYNELRDEYFAELRYKSYPEIDHHLDANNLDDLADVLREHLGPILQGLNNRVD